jgi:hypothetical protein
LDENEEDFSLSSGDRRLPSNEGKGLLRTIFGRGQPSSQPRSQPSTSTPEKSRSDSPVRNDDPLTEKERTQVKLIRQLLDSYVGIVMKNLHDHITKVVMMVLVNDTSSSMNKYLVSHIYKGDGNYKHLLAEMDDVAMRRNAVRHELDALRRAKQVIKMSELTDGVL